MSDESPSAEPGRRSLLAMLGAFAALTLLVVLVSLGAGLRKHTSSSPPSAPTIDPAAAAFLGPLAAGEKFGGWHIQHAETSSPGRITLTLEGDKGERYVVDVLARSPSAPPGIAETSHLSIYLRTEARGAQTPEAAVKGASALADALRAREDAGHGPPPLESLAPR